jgi:hypothetical protein
MLAFSVTSLVNLSELRQTGAAMFDELRTDGFSAFPDIAREASFSRDMVFAAT